MEQICLKHIRLCYSRRAQLIYTIIILLLSIITLLIFSLTSNSLQVITSVFLTSRLPFPPNYYYVSSKSPIVVAENGLIIATETITGTASENGPVLISVVAKNNSISPAISQSKNESAGCVQNKSSGFCDMFDGTWIPDNGSDPLYPPGSCPYLEDRFNCFNNGRLDLGYLRYRWQPYGCDIPRFDGKVLLETLRGKRMVFVGDSLNRNMWESMVCALRMSVPDKTRVSEVSGARQFRTAGFMSYRFQDYNCTVEFIRAPFLVKESKNLIKLRRGGNKVVQQTLRLDMMQGSISKYHDADFLVFNTGRWWSLHKTNNGENFFQEGKAVHRKLRLKEAYTKALQTWANWVDKYVNKSKTKVFFLAFAASHFRGGQWNSGGTCEGETEPITDEKFLGQQPRINKKIFESVISKMRTPVVYLNITKMTDYRKDGHPSIYLQSETKRHPGMIQDCCHWCLPGVPDSWNQLLYASLLLSSSNESTR